MKSTKTVLVLFILFAACMRATSLELPKAEGSLHFIVANDMGRQGYYEQRPVAALMGEAAGQIKAKFVAVAGDPHHSLGVASTQDPRWMTNFELIYDHPSLQIPWNVVLGNHEYHGSTQAIIDYTNISRRWNAPAHYFAETRPIDKKGEQCLFVYIDTPPLIETYREDKDGYPDAALQSREKQLQWIDSTLNASKAQWKVVIGHHPVYAETSKNKKERTEMQKYLEPLLDKHKVDLYVCGHIHNFQHIAPKGKHTQYIVNSSASSSREVSPIEGTLFCNPKAGFSVCSVSNEQFIFSFVASDGEIVYTYSLKNKKTP